MEAQTGWNSPRNEADERAGFNEAAMHHFTGDPYGALAKETIQNAKDAGEDGLPVHVVVELIDVPMAEFPDADGLCEVFEACYRADDSEKANEFFSKGAEMLRGQSLPVLAISDYNTKGAVGPCEFGKPFHTLMKGSGSSQKSDDQANGSFGIGKNAPLIVSALRTVIVSTAYRDEAKRVKRLVQGRATVISHEIDGNKHTGKSYWGMRGTFNPIDPEETELPGWMSSRHSGEQTGTTVFVPGFEMRDGWEDLFIGQVLQHFFCAIAEGHLTVKVCGEMIDANTIHTLFQNPAIVAALGEGADAQKDFIAARDYLDAMRGDDAERIDLDLGRLGLGTLDLVMRPGAAKRVGIVRNGMLITANLEGLRRFTGVADFAAVLRFSSPETNALLRSIEPPAHNALEPERLKDQPETKKHVEIGLREAAQKVRSVIEERGGAKVLDSVNASELRDLLGEPNSAASRGDPRETNPVGRLLLVEERARVSQSGKRRAAVGKSPSGGDASGERSEASNRVRQEGGSGEDGREGEGDVGRTPKPHSEAGGDGVATNAEGVAAEASFLDCRLDRVNGVRTGAGRYRLSFVCPADLTYRLALVPVGFSQTEKILPITRSTAGALDGSGRIITKARAGELVTVDVELADHSYTGAIKVNSHAV